jgi:hypothetical protein
MARYYHTGFTTTDMPRLAGDCRAGLNGEIVATAFGAQTARLRWKQDEFAWRHEEGAAP